MSGNIFFYFIIFLRTQRMKICPLPCLFLFKKLIIFHLFLTWALMWHFLLLLVFIHFVFLCFFLFFFPHWCISGLMQWIAWIRHVPTMASVWMGSATVSQAGEGSTASCLGPSAQTSATATGPSYQTLGCAAVTPTGWDLTALWVSVTAELVQSNSWGKDGLGVSQWGE